MGMIAAIFFESPLGLLGGIPLALAVGFGAWWQRRRGLAWKRIVSLAALRSIAMLPLVLLVARPIWLAKEPAAASRQVMLLMDRSESMSLADPEVNRYQQALKFLGGRLLPALKSARLPVHAMLFDDGIESADGAQLGQVVPKGKRTNLAGAIAQALGSSAQPPLALIALTDGIANENSDNTKALT